MATRTISTRLAISGDDKYKQAIAGCNSELSKLKSSLAATQSEYRNNANSLEALNAKSKALNDLYAAQLNKLKEIRAGLENARNAQKSHASAIDEYKAKIAATESQLEKLKESTGDTSEEQKQLTEELEKLKQGLSEAEAKEAAAAKGVNAYEKQLNNATIQLNNLDDEISQNNQYLEEAKNSADGCAKSIDQYGKEIKDAASEEKSFGEKGTDAINAVASALAAAGIAASVKEIADVLLECVQNAQTFESGMAEVFTLLPQLSQESRNQMTNDIMAFSSEMNVLTDEAVPALYSAISAGVPSSNVFSFMTTAQKAAVGGVTDLETAVDGLTSIVNAYGEETIDATRTADLLFTTVKLGKTNFEQLSQSIYNVVPTAAGAGIAFEDVSAALAVLTAQGRPTSVATTQLRQMLVELADSGSQVGKIFTDISGQTFKQFIASGGTVNDALQKLYIHAEQSSLGINELFSSVEAGSAALSLSGDSTAAFTSALDAMRDSAGAVDTAYSTMINTAEYQTKRMENAFNNVKTSIGTVLMPTLAKLKSAGADALEWVNDFIEENPAIVKAITVVTVGIGAAAAAVAGFAFVVNVAIPAVNALTAALAANPIGAVVIAVTGLVAAIGAFVAICSDENESLNKVNETAKNAKASIEEATKAYEDNSSKIEASAQIADVYITKLEKLEQQGISTKESQEEYKRTVDQLNALIPDLNLQIDEETGLIKGGTAELRINTEAWKENAIAQAMQQKMAAIYEANADVLVEYYRTQKELNDAQIEGQAIQERMDKTFQEIADSLGITTKDLESYGELFHILGDNTLDVTDDTRNLMSTYGELEEQLRHNEDATYDAQEANDAAMTAMEEMEEEVNAAGDAYLSYAETLNNANAELSEQDKKYKEIYETDVPEVQAALDDLAAKYQEAYDAAYQSVDQQLGLFNDMSFEVDTSVQSMIASLDSQIAFMDTYAQNMQWAMEHGVDEGLVAKLSDGSIESAEILQAIVDDGGEHIGELNQKFAEVEEGKENFAGEIAKVKTDFDGKMGDIENRMNKMLDELDQPQKAYKNASETMQDYIDGAESKYSDVYSAYKSLASAANYGWNNNLSLNSSVPHVSGGGTSNSRGRYATGLAYVPYDDFPALLHKGERVLNAQEAIDYLNASIPSYVREGKLPQTDYTPLLSSILSTLQSAGGPTQLHNVFNISGGGASPNQTSREVERLMRRMLYEQ